MVLGEDQPPAALNGAKNMKGRSRVGRYYTRRSKFSWRFALIMAAESFFSVTLSACTKEMFLLENEIFSEIFRKQFFM